MTSIARVPSKLKITGPTRADVTSVLKVWSTRQRFGKNDEDHFHLGLRGLVNESEGFPFLLGHIHPNAGRIVRGIAQARLFGRHAMYVVSR
jgi:hypothetical protein